MKYKKNDKVQSYNVDLCCSRFIVICLWKADAFLFFNEFEIIHILFFHVEKFFSINDVRPDTRSSPFELIVFSISLVFFLCHARPKISMLSIFRDIILTIKFFLIKVKMLLLFCINA